MIMNFSYVMFTLRTDVVVVVRFCCVLFYLIFFQSNFKMYVGYLS